jgi:hypothetical protein
VSAHACGDGPVDLVTLNADRLGARRDYPRLAAEWLVATVRTVMRYWAARPDLDKVAHVAAVHQAVPRYRDMVRQRQVRADRIGELTDQYARLERDLVPVEALYGQHATVLADLGITMPIAPEETVSSE